jgi:hypothetical protein
MQERLTRAEANCRNGQKGGVKTPQGKAVTRLNAQRHGFYSRHLILRNQWVQERQVEFDKLLAELQSDRQPVGIAEDLTVRELAVAYWKLATLQRAERALIQQQLAKVDEKTQSELDRAGRNINEAMVSIRRINAQMSRISLAEKGEMTIEEYEATCKLHLLRELKVLKESAEDPVTAKVIGERLCAEASSTAPSDKAGALRLLKQFLEGALAFWHEYAADQKKVQRILMKRIDPSLDLALIPAGPQGERIMYYKDQLWKRIHKRHLRLYALQNARLKKSEHQCPEAKVKYISPPNHSTEEEKEKEG